MLCASRGSSIPAVRGILRHHLAATHFPFTTGKRRASKVAVTHPVTDKQGGGCWDLNQEQGQLRQWAEQGKQNQDSQTCAWLCSHLKEDINSF